MERQRVTVQEAARILGVKEPAIRKRVKRGTLPHDKTADGRVYVYLDTEESAGESTDRSAGRDELVVELRAQIEYLREENRRKDEIIMQQAVTVRALTAPSEPRESPETASEDVGRGDVREEPEVVDRPQGERRGWWRRIFGG
jgi:excisionase family DNA binding protein